MHTWQILFCDKKRIKGMNIKGTDGLEIRSRLSQLLPEGASVITIKKVG